METRKNSTFQEDEGLEIVVENPVGAVNDAAVDRLRDAIATEGGDEEEHLKGVLRMLGAEIRDDDQLPLFGREARG